MPVWLVTGATGFLGLHLLNVLNEESNLDAEIVTIGRRPASDVTFLNADLDEPESVNQAIASIRPAVVLHLAGKTPPAPADELIRANTQGTVHLLDALRAWGGATRVVLAGSAAELGPVAPEDLPAREEHPCRPVDRYGLSKHLATCAGLAARPPLEVIPARIFNPVGPGQPTTQALGRFAAQLADPGVSTLTVGGLDARRDFIDVRDVARALIALAREGRPGLVYHVGSGESRRVGDGLEHLIRLSGRSVAIRSEPGTHPGGPVDSRASIERIQSHTGWRPRIAWEQSLADLWDEARQRPLVALDRLRGSAYDSPAADGSRRARATGSRRTLL